MLVKCHKVKKKIWIKNMSVYVMEQMRQLRFATCMFS